MNKLNRQLSLFSVLALVAFQPQSLWATSISSGSEEEIDFQKPQKSIPSQPSDLIQDILQKIKNNQHISDIFLDNFIDTSLEEMKQFESKITPEDDIFDNWITLILLTFPQDSHFDRSLKAAKERGEREHATPTAQFNLAFMYLQGQAIGYNPIKGLDFCRKAAERDHAIAQSSLGLTYFKGDIIDRDPKEAFKWCQKAADQGYAEAQFNLGSLYLIGQGMNKNIIKGIEYYEKAADQGHVDAQSSLGKMYLSGKEVDRDLAKAFKWFKEAADQSNVNAQYNLALMYCCGYSVDKNFPIAIEYFTKAANQGHEMSRVQLGNMYREGLGTDINLVQSLKWHLKVLENENIKLNLKIEIEDSIKNIITFIPVTITMENKKNFIKKQKTLKSNLKGFLVKHFSEKWINHADSPFEESEFPIPSLFEVYQKITNIEEILLKTLRAYFQSGFMVTCLQPNNVAAFKSSNCPAIKYYEVQGKSFLTFGQDNIRAADKFMTIFDTAHPVYSAISEILGALTEIHKSFETKDQVSGLAQELKTQYISRLNLMAKNQTLGTIQISANQNLLIEKVKQDIDVLTQLQAIPQQLINLLIEGAPVRNKLFLQNNEHIEPIFED